MRRMHKHDELVLTEDNRAEARLARLKREHAEIQAPLGDLGADLTRGDAAHIDVYQRMSRTEALDQRQHRVDRSLVAADEDAAPSQVPEVLDGALGLFREAEQTLGT